MSKALERTPILSCKTTHVFFKINLTRLRNGEMKTSKNKT